MKALFLIVTAVIIALLSNAQSSVKGVVMDEVGQKMESATVQLLRAKDSVVAKMAVSGKDGSFLIDPISAGKYFIAINVIGHNKAIGEIFELSSNNTSIDLGIITLSRQTKQLSGVTVVASKPLIEQKIDRTIINVEAGVTNVGSSALEVLEKSPGVTVDKDGNISLKGKQGVMIMMDGRPTYLSGTALTDYLKNLPASSLEQIEIMTQPSAKYDAAGNSGIINIKSKKNKLSGFNGSISTNYGQGKYWKTNNNLNLNYRTGKLNLFLNASQSQWNGFQGLSIHRRYFNENTKLVTAIFDQESMMINNNGYYSVKFGADYFLSKRTTIGIVTSGFLNPEQTTSSNTSYLKNPSAIVDSIVYATSDNREKWKNGSLNVNFRQQFDSSGTELTADFDHIQYSSKGNQSFTNTTYLPDWSLINEKVIRSSMPVTININTAKADFAHPFKNGTKLEAGVKSSFVETNNGAFYYNVYTAKEEVDNGKTNQFLYKENINAAYLNLNREFKNWGVQLGLRYEQTNYRGKQFGNALSADSSFKNSYGSLFPTLFVSYKAGNNHQFAVSYGRRIDRPAYQDLNPFLFFLDEYTYNSGNPYIRPKFTNNFELTHTYKGFLTTTLNYSHTIDYTVETFDQAANGYATIIRRGNIGKVDNVGIAISARIPVAKWWNTMLYTNANYSKFNGELFGQTLNMEGANILVNVNNQFKFNKGWSAELSGFYRTRGIEGQIEIDPMGQASMGVGKQILNNKGTIKLNVRDLFYTNSAHGQINFKTTEATFTNRRDSRVLNISFSYRFGKPAKDVPKRKIGGSEDEQSRVKTGGN